MNDYPKVAITALVVRNGSDHTVVSPVHDEGTDMRAEYLAKHCTLAEAITAVSELYYGSKDIDRLLGRMVRQYYEGAFQLDGYAGSLPSIGNISVSVETKLLDWT
jgi:hypothetical protein